MLSTIKPIMMRRDYNNITTYWVRHESGMLGEHMIISIVLSFFNLKFFPILHGWQHTCSYSDGLCNVLLRSVIEYELLLTVIARVRNKSIGNILDSRINIYCQEFKLLIFYCTLVVSHQKSQMSLISLIYTWQCVQTEI